MCRSCSHRRPVEPLAGFEKEGLPPAIDLQRAVEIDPLRVLLAQSAAGALQRRGIGGSRAKNARGGGGFAVAGEINRDHRGVFVEGHYTRSEYALKFFFICFPCAGLSPPALGCFCLERNFRFVRLLRSDFGD